MTQTSNSMTNDDEKIDAIDSTVDQDLAGILERYLEQREAGEAVSRDALLAQHPALAVRLAACLDGMALFDGVELTHPGQKKEDVPASLPESIGDYEIQSELGRGGMGVVYEAREKSLDRIVALKVMRFGVVDPTALERFRREAETAGALHHTNIVPVYATGREGDTSWYAMQRIDGESVAQRIARGNDDKTERPTIDEILDVGIQAAEALDHAHQRDVVHRDVKPANLIIDGEGRVWLTDFGLARRLVDVGATMTGAILGTPRYMSPEQADMRRVDVDHRTDVYSLGATLYEMATGRPPFEGDDPLKVIGQIRYEDVPAARSLRADLPRDLDVVLAKCLEKEPRRRYETAKELADDLRAIREDRAIQARPVTIIERAARWTRKYHARVRIAGIAVLATALTILLTTIGMNVYRESTLGSFRLRAWGGPYMTTMHRAGETSLSKSSVELTVPMRHQQKLMTGDYDMTLAPRGRWSKKLRVPVTGGIPAEYRLRNRETGAREISIDDSFAVTVNGFDEPAVITIENGELRRMSFNNEEDWTFAAQEVEAVTTPLQGDGGPPANRTSTVNFAQTPLDVRQQTARTSLVDDPNTNVPPLALRTPIDLDGDGATETIVAALDTSALLALDSHGDVLWARSYNVGGVDAASRPPQVAPSGKPRSLPGVLDFADIGDRNGDGVHDLIVIFVDIQLGTQTNVCVATIDGKTGAILKIVDTSALKVKDNTLWPFDGLFQTNRAPDRAFTSLAFNSGPVYRSNGFHNSNATRVRGSSNRSQPRIAVPSPLQFVQVNGQQIVVCHEGSRCRCFELDSGKQVGKTITLPFVPAGRPTIVRDTAGDPGLLFHDQVPTATSRQHLFVAYSIDGSEQWRWQASEFVQWDRFTALRNRLDWPLAADADGDGCDEVIVPTMGYRNGRDVGIQMLNGRDGTEMWPNVTPQIVRSAEDGLYRVTLSDDIDDDGWREWATASIAGPPSFVTGPNESTRVGEVFVYIDWISGKTGERITWARHPIPTFSDSIDVAEIDAIRGDVSGGQSGAVEVDFVTGDSLKDAEVESMVLRFEPTSPDAIAIGTGLDYVGPTSDNVAQKMDISESTRAYYVRPGPYSDGDEKIVLLGAPIQQTIRLGEQEILATWMEKDGRELAAVVGFEPKQLAVLEAATLGTVWTTERVNNRSTTVGAYSVSTSIRVGPGACFFPVERADGTVDIIAQRLAGSEVALLDGASGKVLWKSPQPITGDIFTAKLVGDGQWLWIATNGRESNNTSYDLVMVMIEANTGSRLWTRHFAPGASRSNTPQNLNEMQLVDINGDSFPDIIGPDRSVTSDDLCLAAFDGKTGERIWTRSLHVRAAPRSYYANFCVLECDPPAVAFVAKTAQQAAKAPPMLIVCDAFTGEKITAFELEERRLFNADRDDHHKYLAIQSWSPADGSPQLGLLTRVDRTGELRWRRFEFNGVQVTEPTTASIVEETTRSTAMWLRDIDGDQVPERIATTSIWKQAKVDGSATKTLGDKQTRLSCRQIDNDEPMWQVTLPDAWRSVYWEDAERFGAVWFDLNDGRYALVDLRAGKLVNLVDKSAVELPRVTARQEGERGAGFRLIMSTQDGLASYDAGLSNTSTTNLAIHTHHDPRLSEPLFITPAWPLTYLLLNIIQSLTILCTFVIVPSAYVLTMVKRRRFSLSWLLLAPPLVMVMLVVWNFEWVHQPSIVMHLLSGVGWLAGGTALYCIATQRSRQDPFGGRAWIFYAIGGVAMFTLAIVLAHYRDNTPGVRYEYRWQDFSLPFVSSLVAVGYLYWLARYIRRAVLGLKKLLGGSSRLKTTVDVEASGEFGEEIGRGSCDDVG